MEVKLSVVTITLNEERNIRRCLESVKDFADEIVVVDSFSTDNTESICKEYGAKFFENPFVGFIEQKNFATSKATYDYVLFIDADEAVSKRLGESIIKIKKNFDADGYEFNRLNNYCGKWIRHSGWYPDVKLRIWDRRKGKTGGQNPHERFIMNQGSVVKKLKGDLLHYSYYSIFEHIAQVNKFTEVGSLEALKKGRRMNVFKVVFFPLWKFIKTYIIKRGFLDGYMGFVICMISTHESFIKYAKLFELQKKQKNKSV